ncbi:hypothetical protein HZB02_01030 [Candidatus Woesearchaeota archaeon]|nr:hypothetical protein [Candidatus Woesearchaeota archaeon]
MAGVILVLVLAFGYQGVVMISQRTAQAQQLAFEQQLISNIATISHEYGSVKKLDLNIPGKVSKVCFVDLTTYANSFTAGQDQENQAITAALQGFDKNNPEKGPLYNIFLFSDTFQTLYADVVKTTGCFTPTNGKLALKLTGMGDGTEIAYWNVAS